MTITFNKTNRGFGLYNFKDRYDHSCSLQESSLATEGAIWFGIDDPEPKRFIPGQGWVEEVLPEGVDLNTRMHLTQDQVKELLPLLQHFAETGYLPGDSVD